MIKRGETNTRHSMIGRSLTQVPEIRVNNGKPEYEATTTYRGHTAPPTRTVRIVTTPAVSSLRGYRPVFEDLSPAGTWLHTHRDNRVIRPTGKHKVRVLRELLSRLDTRNLGARMVTTKQESFDEEHERELQMAVDLAESRATRELKAALKRLKQEKDDDKAAAVKRQKDYYEKLASRIEEQRNRAEEERQRELTRKQMMEKDEALEKQWYECERLKQEAVALACEAQERKLRSEFAIERERAVTEALRIAKEKYLIREKQTIEKTRRECEEIARKEAERVHKLHQQDIERCNQRYNLLEKKWLREIEFRKNVEADFRDLQDDYRRFMDYTDGMFHSDYLMQLRHMGQKLADKQVKVVTYDDLEKSLVEFT